MIGKFIDKVDKIMIGVYNYIIMAILTIFVIVGCIVIIGIGTQNIKDTYKYIQESLDELKELMK